MLLDLLIGEALKSLKKSGSSVCPSEEDIAAFTSGALRGKEKEEVERHLVRCDWCLELATLCSAIELDQAGIIKESPKVDVIVSFLKNTVEFIKGSKEIEFLPSLSPALTRGQRVYLPNAVRLKKEFEEITVEVEIERVGDDKGEIKVRARRDGAYLNNIRVTLLGRDRELASYPATEGYVIFEDVKFGKYSIKISKNGTSVGEISLRVKEG